MGRGGRTSSPVAQEANSKEFGTAGAGRSWIQSARLAAIIGFVVLFLVLVTTVIMDTLDPTEAELKGQAKLTGKHELLIGVADDRPGLSYRLDSGEYEGFEIDIAYMIAAKLGFTPEQVRFLTVKTEDRRTRQVLDPDSGMWATADLIVASYSITKEREDLDEVMFSASYLRTRMSVVTRTGHAAVASVEDDLPGEKVCTVGTSTAQDQFGKALELVLRQKVRDCIEGLMRYEFDAVLTDAAILAGWVHRYRPQLQQHDIGTDEVQRYGVNVGDSEPLRELVNLALYCSLHDPDDKRWEDAYHKHLAPLQRSNRPQQVAESTQPEKVPEPQVRRFPWEYWVPDTWAYQGRPARCD